MMRLTEIKRIVYYYRKKLGISSVVNLKSERLGRGENNLNFLVTIGKKQFVLRVALKKHIEINMRHEARMIAALPDGVGPHFFVFDNSKKFSSSVFMILSYSPGKTVQKWTKKHFSLVARQLAYLHKKTQTDRCGKQRRQKKFSLYKKLGEWIREDFQQELESKEFNYLYKQLMAVVKEKDYLFTSLKKFSLVHNDLGPPNVIFNKCEVTFIDWEWSTYGDVAVDLALCFSLAGNLFPWRFAASLQTVKFFVDEYQKYSKKKDKTLLERVLLWHDATMFGDMAFCKWLLAHPKTSKLLSLREYKSIYKKKLVYFQKKYGVD